MFVSNIAKMSKNRDIMNSVRLDDWTAEWAIIATGRERLIRSHSLTSFALN